MKCNDAYYGVKNVCKTIDNVKICKQNEILDLKNENCIVKILENKPHNCTITNNDHVENIEEIQTGLILLNDFKGKVNIGNNTRSLNGSYLIKFNNETIQINNYKFSTNDIVNLKPLPTLVQHSNSKSEFEEVLSLQLMKQLNLKNIGKINSLNKLVKSSFFTNLGLLATVMVIIIILTMKMKKSSAIESHITINPEPPQLPQQPQRIEIPTTKIVKLTSLNNIPYF